MNAAIVVFVLVGLGLWTLLVPVAGPAQMLLGVPAIGAAWIVFMRLATFETRVPGRHAAAWIRGVAGYLLFHVPIDISRATFRVFREVLRPHIHIRPAIVAVPLPGASPGILMLMAYGICLTPGEQAVEIDEERRILYVHGLFVPDPDRFRAGVAGVYERYFSRLVADP